MLERTEGVPRISNLPFMQAHAILKVCTAGMTRPRSESAIFFVTLKQCRSFLQSDDVQEIFSGGGLFNSGILRSH